MATSNPRVIFIVGVNGAGKKPPRSASSRIVLRQQNLNVVLCAADTFRAAAIEQLEIWAHRNGIEVYQNKNPGSDPAAGGSCFDAMAAARARNAGRGAS